MKNIRKRALCFFALVAVLTVGMGVFLFRLVVSGEGWATFYANRHVYSKGVLAVGGIYDRNGVMLAQNTREKRSYSDDAEIRLSVFQLLGDEKENVSTGLMSLRRKDLINYTFVNGTNGVFYNEGNPLHLTIDARISKAAWQALDGRDGTVFVYDKDTGEALACVSAPSLDMTQPVPETSSLPSGTYMNKAAIGLYNAGPILDLPAAQAELEGVSLSECVREAGLTTEYDLDGIVTAAGKFHLAGVEAEAGKSVGGQGKNMINPISVAMYVGAIAGEGTTAKPKFVSRKYVGSVQVTESAEKLTLMDKGTAAKLKNLMEEGDSARSAEGLSEVGLCAKTGRAVADEKGSINDLLVGFSGDYIIFVCVEDVGDKSGAAAEVAVKVMREVRRIFGQGS